MSLRELRTARQQKGWSQKEAAARLGFSQPYLSMLEAGQRTLPSRLARQVVRVFNLPATALPLSRPEWRPMTTTTKELPPNPSQGKARRTGLHHQVWKGLAASSADGMARAQEGGACALGGWGAPFGWWAWRDFRFAKADFPCCNDYFIEAQQRMHSQCVAARCKVQTFLKIMTSLLPRT